MTSTLSLLPLLLAIAACGDDGPGAEDSGVPPTDMGRAIADAGEDGGPLEADAGAGEDAGPSELDAGAGEDAGPADAGEPDAGPGDAGPPDLGGPTATAEECFEGWATLPAGSCPAPVITASYVGAGCAGTDGWFIEGANFQLRERRVGLADLGPQSIGVNGNQSHWNVITTNLLCVTIFRGSADTWAGHDVHVVNPDGQASNTVTIENRF